MSPDSPTNQPREKRSFANLSVAYTASVMLAALSVFTAKDEIQDFTGFNPTEIEILERKLGSIIQKRKGLDLPGKFLESAGRLKDSLFKNRFDLKKTYSESEKALAEKLEKAYGKEVANSWLQIFLFIFTLKNSLRLIRGSMEDSSARRFFRKRLLERANNKTNPEQSIIDIMNKIEKELSLLAQSEIRDEKTASELIEKITHIQTRLADLVLEAEKLSSETKPANSGAKARINELLKGLNIKT